MNLKNIFAVSLSSLFLALPSKADTISRETTDNLTYVSVGATMINMDNINKTLAPIGYPNFPGNITFFGTGNRTISGRIVTGGEGFFTLENKVVNTQNGHRGFNSASFSMIGDIGYLVYSGNNFRLYPMIGAGIGRVFVDLFKDEKNPSYNDLIKDPDKGIALASTNVLADLALGGDYVIGIGKSTPKKGGIIIGFRTGYLFTVYSTGLQLKGEPIKDAPSINNNGFYIRLNVGYTEGIIPALIDIFKKTEG